MAVVALTHLHPYTVSFFDEGNGIGVQKSLLGMKQFNTMRNIGRAKYVINSHNGIDTHKDGSPFFGIEIFKNKRKFEQKIKELKKAGYTEK